MELLYMELTGGHMSVTATGELTDDDDDDDDHDTNPYRPHL